MKTTESKWSAIRWPRGKRCLSMRCWEASSGNIGGDIWWLVFVNTGRPLWVVLLIISSYRLVFKRGNGKSPVNGDLNGNILYIYIYIFILIYEWEIFPLPCLIIGWYLTTTCLYQLELNKVENRFVPGPRWRSLIFFSDDMFPRSPCPTN